MRYEIILTGLLSVLVNGLLLVSANRLCAMPQEGMRCAVAAVTDECNMLQQLQAEQLSH